MKKISLLALIIGILPMLSFGLEPINTLGVAKKLTPIGIKNIQTHGVVLKEEHSHPFTTFTIGIPVQINTKSACTDFIGQETTTNIKSQLTHIRAFGSYDAINTTCIAVMPTPIDTMLTYDMVVTTGGFVAAEKIQRRQIKIEGNGLFQIELNMNSSKVTLTPVTTPAPR